MEDFILSPGGDLILTETLEVGACTEERLREQLALCRIKSVTKDWHEAHVGADLEQFLGQPATPEVLREMEMAVVQALCIDNAFNRENIFVNTSITNKSYVKMLVYIKTLNNKGSFCIDVQLDLVKGVNVVIGG